jgi:hypothetical protein
MIQLVFQDLSSIQITHEKAKEYPYLKSLIEDTKPEFIELSIPNYKYFIKLDNIKNKLEFDYDIDFVKILDFYGIENIDIPEDTEFNQDNYIFIKRYNPNIIYDYIINFIQLNKNEDPKFIEFVDIIYIKKFILENHNSNYLILSDFRQKILINSIGSTGIIGPTGMSGCPGIINSIGQHDYNAGNNNVCLGCHSLKNNNGGASNVGLGSNTLRNNTFGSNNTALGYNSLKNNKTGNKNTSLGYNSGINIIKDNNITINNPGHYLDKNTTKIGNNKSEKCHIYGINNNNIDGNIVIINEDNQLGTTNITIKSLLERLEFLENKLY